MSERSVESEFHFFVYLYFPTNLQQPGKSMGYEDDRPTDATASDDEEQFSGRHGTLLSNYCNRGIFREFNLKLGVPAKWDRPQSLSTPSDCLK